VRDIIHICLLPYCFGCSLHVIDLPKYNNVLLFMMASGEEKWFLQLDYVKDEVGKGKHNNLL
jgi:hypothetical protein